MKIAFYGTAPEVGTSANMAVVAEFLRCCRGRMAGICPEIFCENSAIIFKNYSHRKDEIRNISEKFDLLVVNLPASDRKFENIFFKNSLVQKNVIFLFGKYFHNDADALLTFAKNYRIDKRRICAIPYNLRFQQAYENRMLSAYLLQSKPSYEDEVFQENLLQTIQTIFSYAGR